MADQNAEIASGGNHLEYTSQNFDKMAQSRFHPSLLRGTAKEERLIERQVARSQITDLVSDLRNSVADKDTTLKLERVNHRNKIEWLKEQIESVQTDLIKLHEYKESLERVQGPSTSN